MTTKQIQDLAKLVATLHNVSVYKTLAEEEPFYDDECNFRGYQKKRLYLENDLDAVMRLAIENSVDIEHYTNFVRVCGINCVNREFLKDHADNRVQATMVSVMRVLVKIKR